MKKERKIWSTQVLVDLDQLEYILLCAIAIALYTHAMLKYMMLLLGYMRNSVHCMGRTLKIRFIGSIELQHMGWVCSLVPINRIDE